MKFSTRVRYGMRAMLELAQSGEDRPVPLTVLAQRQNLSIKYLENLFHALRDAGLVLASRGPHGGYRLARPADGITVLEVAQALDGRVHLVECVGNPRFCDQTNHCQTFPLWADLSRVLEVRMAQISLSMLVRNELSLVEVIHE
ncbi:MAG: AsnC family transcriptional regulator [Deltaproteobacteria bacterium HGW-Deltaproteobacteria-22]|nr:MAG: AsnC family transcriptional regulator [Deltaproteobacteria bacterium HGW-Deltaproteobacteria-22]